MKKLIMILVMGSCFLGYFLGVNGVCFSDDDSFRTISSGTTEATNSLSIQATIPEICELTIWTRRYISGGQGEETEKANMVDPYGEGTDNLPAAAPLDFGTISISDPIDTTNDAGEDRTYRVFTGQYAYCVFFSAYTQGKPYKITQTVQTDKLADTLLVAADYCGADLMGDFTQERNGAGDSTLLDGNDDVAGQGAGGLVMDNRGEKVIASRPKNSTIFLSNTAVDAKPRIFRCWYSLAGGLKGEPVDAVSVGEIAPQYNEAGVLIPCFATVTFTATTDLQ
ncbi:MAG: hypothetical protein KKF54_06735 [Candidatus Omnitrophica bacterium]|nr:hypothetical protein [Candidatus Omnitrophota bacterium]